jgi:hypothetical protein
VSMEQGNLIIDVMGNGKHPVRVSNWRIGDQTSQREYEDRWVMGPGLSKCMIG